MPERSAARIQVWNYLIKLQQAGLGRAERVSEQRDKFSLDLHHIAAKRLSNRPDANGFIRSDKNSLLFRAASELLRQAVPDHIRTRAMVSNKGLEFRWTQLEPDHIDKLLAAVVRIAEGSNRSSAVPNSEDEEPRIVALINSESPVTREPVEAAPKTGAATARSLADFRSQLSELMGSQYERPFVCSSSPLDAQVFIVGFNPATSMDKPFWHYWSDSSGFDKRAFMQDYLQKRALQGVRPRIERIVAQLRPGSCLETNICSKPTKTARELSQADARTDIFRFLLRTIRPKVVFVHSNDPIDYLERLVGCTGIADGEFKRVQWDSHEFLLRGRRGPLFRMGFAEAEEIGRRIQQAIESTEKPGRSPY